MMISFCKDKNGRESSSCAGASRAMGVYDLDMVILDLTGRQLFGTNRYLVIMSIEQCYNNR